MEARLHEELGAANASASEAAKVAMMVRACRTALVATRFGSCPSLGPQLQSSVRKAWAMHVVGVVHSGPTVQDQLGSVGGRIKSLRADVTRHSHTLKQLSSARAAAAADKENQQLPPRAKLPDVRGPTCLRML